MNNIPIPADAADYPKTFAARLALAELAQRKQEEYDRALAEVKSDPARKLEKKIYIIQRQMAEHARSFVCQGYSASALAGQLEARRKMLLKNGLLSEAALAELSPDEEGVLLLFAHASFLLHNAFIEPHLAHLAAVRSNGHPEEAFEDRIILGTLYELGRDWLGWYRENGAVPFERWTYEEEFGADSASEGGETDGRAE